MACHQCPIIHQLNPKTFVDVKNGQLEAIKAAKRLSRCPIHAQMFEVGFYFRSLTTTKPIIKEALVYYGHRCPAIRFMYRIESYVSRIESTIPKDVVCVATQAHEFHSVICGWVIVLLSLFAWCNFWVIMLPMNKCSMTFLLESESGFYK